MKLKTRCCVSLWSERILKVPPAKSVTVGVVTGFLHWCMYNFALFLCLSNSAFLYRLFTSAPFDIKSATDLSSLWDPCNQIQWHWGLEWGICLCLGCCAIKTKKKSCSFLFSWLIKFESAFLTFGHTQRKKGVKFPHITLAVLWLHRILSCRIWFWLSGLGADSIPVEPLSHGQQHYAQQIEYVLVKATILPPR